MVGEAALKAKILITGKKNPELRTKNIPPNNKVRLGQIFFFLNILRDLCVSKIGLLQLQAPK